MSAKGISHVYASAPKVGGKRPVIGRPSDVAKKTKASGIIDRACQVHTTMGILYARNVHGSKWGDWISINGHELKVSQIGPGVWMEKGKTYTDCPNRDHSASLRDKCLTDTPVRIYSDYARLAPVKMPGRSKLTGPFIDLIPQVKLENVSPSYKVSPKLNDNILASQAAKDDITKIAGITKEMETWLKNIGK